MRTAWVLIAVAGSAVGLAACGGSGSGSTASGSRASGAGIPGPVKIYRAKLSGAAEGKGGASSATGDVIIAFHRNAEACWRFAHLHGFSGATSARIYNAPQGKSGRAVISLSRGPHLHHQGCVRARPAVIAAIERSPRDYYVNVHSVRYPRGAVRAQL